MPQHAQLGFRNYEFGVATIQTDQKLWKYPHDGLVQTLESGEVNSDFPVKLALLFGVARLARHSARNFQCLGCTSFLRLPIR